MLLVVLFLLHFLATNGIRRLKFHGSKVVIVQNKGGGYGSLGYLFAKEFLSENLEVTLLQESGFDSNIVPFNRYSSLSDAGVNIKYFSDISAVKLTNNYDVLIDNWSKSTENATRLAGGVLAETPAHTPHLVYVSSASVYAPPATASRSPMAESSPLLATSEVAAVEAAYARWLGEGRLRSATFLRPQYLFGPLCHKHHLDYFLARIVMQQPVALPSPGDQLLCLTDEGEAVRQMLVAVAHAVAPTIPPRLHSTTTTTKKQQEPLVFNVNSDRYLTYRSLCLQLAELCGKQLAAPQLQLCEPNDTAGLRSFPFRPYTFLASSRQLRELQRSLLGPDAQPRPRPLQLQQLLLEKEVRRFLADPTRLVAALRL